MTTLFQANFGDDVDLFGNSSRPFCPRNFNCSAEPSFVSFDIGRIPSYIAIASGSLSCLGAILIVLVFWLFRDLRTGAAQKIITLQAIADFITAAGYITGSINFLVYFDEKDSKKCRQFEIICEVQASVTSLSSLCSFYWTLILAFHFCLIIVYNRRPLALRLFPLYHIIAWGTPFLVIVPLIGIRKLGYAPYATANWCFVKEIQYDSGLLDHYKSIIFIFLAGKFWEILTYFGVIIMYVHICGHISRMTWFPEKKRFICIPVFFLLLRLWGTVQFFYSIAMSGKLKNHDGCLPKGVHTGFYILGIMQAIGDPGQGWSNAILFVFMSAAIRKRLSPNLKPRSTTKLLTRFLTGNSEPSRCRNSTSQQRSDWCSSDDPTLEESINSWISSIFIASGGIPDHSTDTETILPVTDTAGETHLMIEANKKLHFEYKGYGLKLDIPENTLPQGVEKCPLSVRALLSGQFELPPDCTLVSAVYQIEVPVRFARPVTLEIQHCSSHENSDSASLGFVIADTSKKVLPHRFKDLEGGTFSPETSYGSISLDHFSLVAIIRRVRRFFSPSLRYCAQLYCICQHSTTDWKLHFVITKNLDLYITVIRQKLEKNNVHSDVTVYDEFSVKFQDDNIILSIPKEGVKTTEGWNISCRHHPSISRAEVDNFQPTSGGIPGCLLHIDWKTQQLPCDFEHEITLSGAKPPRNYFNIVYRYLPQVAVAHVAKLPSTELVSPEEHGRKSMQYKRVLNTREVIIRTLADCVSVEALADRLHRNCLIGDDSRREAHDRGVDACKIRRMIDAVICKVDLNPANYDRFIDVLREFGDLGDLIEHIERVA